MKIKVAAAGAVVLFCPLLGQAAGLYLGAAGAFVDRPQYGDVDSTFGGKAYLGYRFAPAPIFLEASYIDAGSAKVTSIDGVKIGFHGYTLGAGWFGELSPLGSGAWLRGAYYSGTSKLEDKFGLTIYNDGDKQNTSGGSFAVGAQWKPAEWFGLRLEYESLINVKDFSANKSIDLVTLGVVLEFGSEPHLRRASSSYSPPLAEQNFVPAEPPPAAPPVSSAPPAPEAPTPLPGFQGVPLGADVPLRTQPRVSAQTQLILRAGTIVRTSQPLSNSDGNWYYAEDAAGHSGWIPASTLPR